MGARRERGAYGNARGKPDKQVRRRRLRESDPRYKAAMEEIRRNQEEIERLAADEPVVTGRIKAQWVKPEESEVVVTAEPIPRAIKYVPCHCGHGKTDHSVGTFNTCKECICVSYRPNTAPDPLLRDSLDEMVDINVVIRYGSKSENKRTATLANKVQELITELRDRVGEEMQEAAQREERMRKAAEVEQRVKELETQLAEARGQLEEIKPKRSRATSKPRKPLKFGIAAAEEFYCPNEDCERHTRPFGTPQGLGAHRFRAHGYRKGDDN